MLLSWPPPFMVAGSRTWAGCSAAMLVAAVRPIMVRVSTSCPSIGTMSHIFRVLDSILVIGVFLGLLTIASRIRPANGVRAALGGVTITPQPVSHEASAAKEMIRNNPPDHE